MTQFEGHIGKESAAVAPMFHPACDVQAPPAQPPAIQGFKMSGKSVKTRPAPPSLD